MDDSALVVNHNVFVAVAYAKFSPLVKGGYHRLMQTVEECPQSSSAGHAPAASAAATATAASAGAGASASTSQGQSDGDGDGDGDSRTQVSRAVVLSALKHVKEMFPVELFEDFEDDELFPGPEDFMWIEDAVLLLARQSTPHISKEEFCSFPLFTLKNTMHSVQFFKAHQDPTLDIRSKTDLKNTVSVVRKVFLGRLSMRPNLKDGGKAPPFREPKPKPSAPTVDKAL